MVFGYTVFFFHRQLHYTMQSCASRSGWVNQSKPPEFILIYKKPVPIHTIWCVFFCCIWIPNANANNRLRVSVNYEYLSLSLSPLSMQSRGIQYKLSVRIYLIKWNWVCVLQIAFPRDHPASSWISKLMYGNIKYIRSCCVRVSVWVCLCVSLSVCVSAYRFWIDCLTWLGYCIFDKGFGIKQTGSVVFSDSCDKYTLLWMISKITNCLFDGAILLISWQIWGWAA